MRKEHNVTPHQPCKTESEASRAQKSSGETSPLHAQGSGGSGEISPVLPQLKKPSGERSPLHAQGSGGSGKISPVLPESTEGRNSRSPLLPRVAEAVGRSGKNDGSLKKWGSGGKL